MFTKIFLTILLIIGIFAIQYAFISGLPYFFRNINLLLIVLIFILVLSSFQTAIWWAFGFGLLLSIYGFLPFGIYLAAMVATIIFLNFLYMNFFTDRSLYTFLALAFFGLLFYQILLYSLSFLVNFFQRKEFGVAFDKLFWFNEISIFLVNIVLVVIIFYIFNFISRSLKPVFISHKLHQ